MKIKVVAEEKKRVSIWIPTWLMVNYFSALLVPLFANRELKKYGFRLTVPMCWKFVHVFNKTKRHFGRKLDIVDVEAADGTTVKITL